MSNSSSAEPRRRRRPSVAAVLGLSFGALLLLAVATVLATTFLVAQRNTEELTDNVVQVTTSALIARIEDHLQAPYDQVEALARGVAGGVLNPNEVGRFMDTLAAILAAAPQTRTILVALDDQRFFQAVRRRGGIHRVVDANWRRDERDVETYNEVRRVRETHWGRPVLHRETGEPLINVRTALVRGDEYLGASEEFLGVVFAGVEVDDLSEFVFELADDLPPSGTAFVLYDRDRVLAHPLLVQGYPGLTLDAPLPPLRSFSDPILAGIWDTSGQTDTIDFVSSPVEAHWATRGDKTWVYFYREVEGLADKPLQVGFYLDWDQVKQPGRRLLWAGSIGVAIAVLGVVAALLLGRMLSGPVRRLALAAESVRHIERGFQSFEPLARSPFKETDEAAEAFNTMVQALTRLEPYLPRTLVRRLVHLGMLGQLESESRELTIMFTDIAGFTTMSEQMNATDVAVLLNHHFNLLAACIEETGGTVDKYIGDSVMAFWGAPERQDDHAVRACRAAAAIRLAVARDNDTRRAAGRAPVRLRIGLHTGQAVVGNIGAESRINYTLVGDTVNTTNRLEQLAKQFDRGDDVEILVSSDTAARLADGRFAFTDLGEQDLRGRTRTIRALRMLWRDGAPLARRAGNAPKPSY